MAEKLPQQPEQAPQETGEKPEQAGVFKRIIESVRSGVSGVLAGLGAAGAWGIKKLNQFMGGNETVEVSGKGETPSGTKAKVDVKKEEKPAEGPTEFSAKYKGQWGLKANKDGYNITNEGTDGKKDFYEVVMGEEHGNPIIVWEPDRALPIPSGVNIVDAQGKPAVALEKISGILCKVSDAKERFSLSSPEAPKFTLNSDGSMFIEGDSTPWYLITLSQYDKNRFVNYNAYFSRKKPSKVRIVELEDSPFYEEHPDEFFAAPKMAA